MQQSILNNCKKLCPSTNNLIRDNVDEKSATPFAYGSGHVQPNLAIDPGLVYDLKPSDYLNFLCGSGYEERLVASFNNNKPYKFPRSYNLKDFNYPSITLSRIGVSPITITRTVTNVGPPSTYVVSVQAPIGVKVLVRPNTLSFKKTGKKTFRVTLQAGSLPQPSNSSFGSFSWTDGKHRVRSPIAIVQLENGL